MTTETTVAARSMLDALGLESRGLSSAGAEVQDQELRLQEGEFFEILLFGVRRQLIEGGPSKEPMETWHGLCRGKNGLMPRSLRGRAQLGDQVRAQVLDNGLCYVDATTGEVQRLPGHQGVWILASAADPSAKALLLVRTRFDLTKGAMAGKGRRIAYVTLSGGVALEKARKVYPELETLSLDAALALPHDATGERMLEVEATSAGPAGPALSTPTDTVPVRGSKAKARA